MSNRKCLLRILETGTSKVDVPARWISSWGCLSCPLGSCHLSLCPQDLFLGFGWREREEANSLGSLLYYHKSHDGGLHPHRSLTLTTSHKPDYHLIPKYHHIVGQSFNTYILDGHSSVQSKYQVIRITVSFGSLNSSPHALLKIPNYLILRTSHKMEIFCSAAVLFPLTPHLRAFGVQNEPSRVCHTAAGRLLTYSLCRSL